MDSHLHFACSTIHTHLHCLTHQKELEHFLEFPFSNYQKKRGEGKKALSKEKAARCTDIKLSPKIRDAFFPLNYGHTDSFKKIPQRWPFLRIRVKLFIGTVVANRLATPNSRLAIPSGLSVKLGRIGRWLGKNGGGQSTELLVCNLPIH